MDSASQLFLPLLFAFEQDVDCAGSAVTGGGGAECDDAVVLAQPVVDPAFEDGFAVAGSVAFAVDDVDAAPTSVAGMVQEGGQFTSGGDGVHAVQVDFTFAPVFATFEFAHGFVLYAVAAVFEVFVSLYVGSVFIVTEEVVHDFPVIFFLLSGLWGGFGARGMALGGVDWPDVADGLAEQVGSGCGLFVSVCHVNRVSDSVGVRFWIPCCMSAVYHTSP